jgi:hypothetical protein
VLQVRCTTCHSDPPNSGAPIKLTTHADAKAHASALTARVDAGTMPPDAETNPLSAKQKAELLNWVNSGAPGDECAGGPGCPEDPNRCAGEQFLPCTPDVQIQAFGPDPKVRSS